MIDIESITVQLKRQQVFYDKFKKECESSNITIGSGIREAIWLWLRYQMGDRETTRYLAQVEFNRELIALVRKVEQAETIEEAGKLLRKIITQHCSP